MRIPLVIVSAARTWAHNFLPRIQDTDTFQVNSARIQLHRPVRSRQIYILLVKLKHKPSDINKPYLQLHFAIEFGFHFLTSNVSHRQKFTASSMDWTTPGDLHNRFRIFKQKCNLIFDGPLGNKAEDEKARLLLLWAGDKGLEIYNKATWSCDEDQLNENPSPTNLKHTQNPRSVKFYQGTSCDA